jgi:ABC-type nitrate/sulfonate/bicarbonate transport system substrate-binding protein
MGRTALRTGRGRGAIALIALTAAVAVAASLAACGRTAGDLEPAVVSLDYVPNTNHTGLYVALDKGWYAEEGIDLEIQTPSDPSAALRQVGAGNTEFGVSFQEEVTIARASGIPVVSIAAVIQHNTSAFAALATSGITRPSEFEGRRYASYALPIEPAILGSLMACDGGDPSLVEFVDVGFDVFPALVGGQVDLAWLFMGWDGVQAELQGVELATFPLYGSCVPDYYTPVLIAGEGTLADKGDLTERFLRATVRGYEFAIANPEESAEILITYTPEANPDLIRASQAYLSPRYQDDAPAWGVQERAVWEGLSTWMAENGLIDAPIDVDAAFTTEYMP